jgi:imidazolonepropionase-like amidohydrolase
LFINKRGKTMDTAKMNLRRMLPGVFCLALVFHFAAPPVRAADAVVLKVGTLLKGDGLVLMDAVILIRNGKIESIGKSAVIPQGAVTYEFKTGTATPGFIAANAYLRVSRETREVEMTRYDESFNVMRFKVLALNEERSETTPEMNLLYSVDPAAGDLAEAWRSGVTCIYVAPGSQNVFNGSGTILKTWGRTPQDMVVRNAVDIRVTLGEEPGTGDPEFSVDPRLRTRRPENRMGVDSIFRSALVNLQNKSQVPDSELSPQERLFRQVLRGETRLRIRARSYIDIKAALRYQEEFGFRWILEEGVDAYKFLEELKAKNVPVIYGPVFRPKGRSDFNIENDFYRPRTPLLLAEKGILFAFQNDSQSPVSALRDEAIYAIGLGLDSASALKALTSQAARILGVADRVGTVEKGKDADVLIWSGGPFDPTSRLEKVLVDGIVMDPHEQ